MHIDKNDYPALGFKFKVTSTNQMKGVLGPLSGVFFDPDESFFQSVSGIGADLSTSAITDAGCNNRQYQLPGTTTYTDLVLSRGLIKSESPIAKWVSKLLTNDSFSYQVTLKTVNVFLMEKDEKNQDRIVMAWSFFNCYPKGLEIGAFNADKSEIAVERLKLTYTHFNQYFNN